MKKSMSALLGKIYQLVKMEKTVDIVLFCKKLDLSPSTFYNYRKFVIDRYENIIYEDGSFKWVDEDHTEQLNQENNNDS